MSTAKMHLRLRIITYTFSTKPSNQDFVILLYKVQTAVFLPVFITIIAGQLLQETNSAWKLQYVKNVMGQR